MKALITSTITTKKTNNDKNINYLKYKLGSIGVTALISFDRSSDLDEMVFITEINLPED